MGWVRKRKNQLSSFEAFLRLSALFDLVASLTTLAVRLANPLARCLKWSQQDHPAVHPSEILSSTSLISFKQELVKFLSYFLVITQKFITFGYLCPCLRIKKKALAKTMLNLIYLKIKNLSLISVNFTNLFNFFFIKDFQVIPRVNFEDFKAINTKFLISFTLLASFDGLFNFLHDLNFSKWNLFLVNLKYYPWFYWFLSLMDCLSIAFFEIIYCFHFITSFFIINLKKT